MNKKVKIKRLHILNNNRRAKLRFFFKKTKGCLKISIIFMGFDLHKYFL